MERREALRLLATGTALQLAPRNLLTVLRGARRLLDTPASPRTLNAHQFATVRIMAELILPRTETPGATDVGASEFIDLLLTEWYDERDRTRFLNGLADVDTRVTALFGKNFVDSSPAQQADILTALGEKMIEDRDRGRDQPPTSDTQPDSNFYSMLRELTLNAYYTSEAGATQELHFEVIPDSHEECAPMPSAKGAPQN
ncbi:MAG TPA: gluconate 2-dehydrogenase subunit 3 family protein [Candidatus Sulfotelmatobacter sp.]|nr:gluconate 2-dehydrogenase subunit 3 family protein [Candidatus Sulfotelmatobacter sp.]